MVDEQRPRRTDQFGEISAGRHQDGRDSCCFDHSCDQTNCLVVKRSRRYEQEEVDIIVMEFLGQCRSRNLVDV